MLSPEHFHEIGGRRHEGPFASCAEAVCVTRRDGEDLSGVEDRIVATVLDAWEAAVPDRLVESHPDLVERASARLGDAFAPTHPKEHL